MSLYPFFVPLYMLIGGAIFGLIYRAIMKFAFSQTTRGVSANIDNSGRIARASIGIGLCIFAIAVPGHDGMRLGAGFAFCEAAFSRCGLYAAMGKNSCPL